MGYKLISHHRVARYELVIFAAIFAAIFQQLKHKVMLEPPRCVPAQNGITEDKQILCQREDQTKHNQTTRDVE